jgi:hypothetical protein
VNISRADASTILDLSSRHAATVIAALVDERTRSREQILRAVHSSQIALVRDIVALDNAYAPGPPAVVWVNTYFAEDFEKVGLYLLHPGTSPEPFYVFSPSAFDSEEQRLCDDIHTGITRGIGLNDKHLSDLLAGHDAPDEVIFHITIAASGEMCLLAHDAAPAYITENLGSIQWYRDVLFPGAQSTNPERASWIYVHLGLPHRKTLAVRAAGVYLMMRSEEHWHNLRSHLKVGFRNFLSDILFSHTYQRLREKQREANAVFAAVSHELNALYEKQFKTIPSKLTAPGLEDVAHAWRLTASMAWLGSLQGRTMAYHWKEDEEGVRDCRDRFCAPLRALALRGILPAALRYVAQEVAHRERPSSLQASAQCVAFDQEHSGILQLSPQEFVVCYLLVAEPVRNHVQHGRGLATWQISEKAEAIKIVLDAPRLKDSNLGSSITFENLGKFLNSISLNDTFRSDAQHTEPDGHDRWEVTLGRPLFTTTPDKKNSGACL